MRPLALCLGVYLALGVLPAPAQRIAATPPKFTVSPQRKLNFGRVKVGKQKTRWFTIRNRGGGNVGVSWNPHPSSEFSSESGGTTLNANARRRYKCVFQPPDSGRYEAPLTFITDDPQRPEVTVLLVGQGYFPR